jgi:hypothetical protein
MRDWKGCVESLMKTDASTTGSFFAAMAYWQLGDRARARDEFDRADKSRADYEERRKKHHAWPPPATLRRIRAEAASLLGIEGSNLKRAPETTPMPGNESK